MHKILLLGGYLYFCSIKTVPMKHLSLLCCYIVLLLGVSACVQRPYPRVLLLADSLASVAPDSARSLLSQWADSASRMPERVQMYYRLLTVKAADKAYILHTSDSLIKAVVAYYEDGGDPSLLPEAYYYAGRVYRDLGDAPQALDYFEQAADVLPPQGQEVLAGKIYSQTGTLFTYQDMYEEALQMYRRAYEYDVKERDVRGQVFDLRDIGDAYQELEKTDSALIYIQKAYDLASESENMDMLSLLQGQRLSLYLQLQKYDSAEVCLREAFKQVHKASRSGLYFKAAELYNYTGRLDSAIYYWKQLLDCGTIYAKEMAHFALAQVAMQRKNMDKTLEHFVQYQWCNDSIRRLTNTETLRQMHSLYNYKLREKENQKLKAEKQQRQFVFYAALGTCVLLLAVAFGYVQYVRRKRVELQQRLEYANRVKEEAEQRSGKFIWENEQKIAALEQQLREADAAHREQLQRQKEMMEWENRQARAAMEKQRLLKETMVETDIRKELVARLSTSHVGNKMLKERDWPRIEREIEACSSDFKEKLQTLYPDFSEFEYHLCLLIRLGMRPVDMAELTAHTKESVTAARRRMYEKVFRKKGTPSGWDEIILSL